jgi:hypothetical protein
MKTHCSALCDLRKIDRKKSADYLARVKEFTVIR